MRMINKLLVTCIILASVGLGSCTKNFKDINTDPNGIYPNQVSVDYAYLGEPLNQAQLNIYGYVDYVYQIQQNLNADIYSGYMMFSDPFYTNNQNNTNYFMIDAWNSQFWDLAYNSVMAPIATVLQSTKGNTQFAPFYAWAKILRVEAMHRLSDQMGPIVYSHYGQLNPDGSSTYDSQQDVYTAFFNELDSSIATFTTAAATG
ncbi:MAG TPA: SusD/RagB family nutrient-binding outer membrane lipoprotein, partial [Puia sp.]|nr:SusD/RagB family nutrient-binding outer membrane lipoprotein [Puia sp.]